MDNSDTGEQKRRKKMPYFCRSPLDFHIAGEGVVRNDNQTNNSNWQKTYWMCDFYTIFDGFIRNFYPKLNVYIEYFATPLYNHYIHMYDYVEVLYKLLFLHGDLFLQISWSTVMERWLLRSISLVVWLQVNLSKNLWSAKIS